MNHIHQSPADAKMLNAIFFNGLRMGMEEQGAVYDKVDSEAVYFTIPQSSELTNRDTLSRAARPWKDLVGLKLRVRFV